MSCTSGRRFPSGLKFLKKQNQNGVSCCSRGVIALIVSQPGAGQEKRVKSSTSNTSVVKTSTLCRVASEVWGRSCGS